MADKPKLQQVWRFTHPSRTGAALIDLGCTEQQFSDTLYAIARQHKWRVAHFRNGRTASGNHATAVQYDAAGWFDWVLVGGKGELHLAELKSARNTLEPHQQAWATIAAAAIGTNRVHCWSPRNVTDALAIIWRVPEPEIVRVQCGISARRKPQKLRI